MPWVQPHGAEAVVIGGKRARIVEEAEKRRILSYYAQQRQQRPVERRVGPVAEPLVRITSVLSSSEEIANALR